MLIAESLTKTYLSGDKNLTVLDNVSFTIQQGQFVSIVGPSGSGKTTLLGLLAGLDTPTRGNVILDGDQISSMTEDERARVRRDKVGFIFQNFQLIPSLTTLENVQVPLELAGNNAEIDPGTRAGDLLERVGLKERVDHFPAQLSGGEQQRVAIARAFANYPSILFADEPTGNLDAAAGQRIIEILEALNREANATIVLVTHDPDLAERADRTLRVADGRIISDSDATVTQPALSDTLAQQFDEPKK